MKKYSILAMMVLLSGQLAFAQSISEERQEKAKENVEQKKKAEEVIQREEEVHPHERISPESQESLFEEMQKEDAAKNPRQEEEFQEL
ncbi:MAG TPA: hypothetical protein VNJ08_16665 [Bacteriovoracaceae bacterium]|nr:hypothetical protein [Bacteriovoracaceae bacterium]